MEELVYALDVCSILCKSEVLRHEVEESGLSVLCDETLYCIESECLNACAGLSALPCSISCELCAYSSPVSLSKNLLVCESH